MNVNEIKTRIDDLTDTWIGDDNRAEKIAAEINKLSDVDKEECFVYFISKLYDYDSFLIYSLENFDSLEDKIKEAKAHFKDTTKFQLSDSYVDDLFNKAGLVFEKIRDEEIKNKKDAVTRAIKKLESDLEDVVKEASASNLSLVDWLNNEIISLENKKSMDIKAINEQIQLIELVLAEKKNSNFEENLQVEIDKLRKEQEDIVAKSGGYPSEEDEKRYHEINEIIKAKEKVIQYRNSYSGKSNEDLKNEIENLKKEQKDIVAKSGGYPSEEDEKRYHEINEIVIAINDLIENNNYQKYNDKSNEQLINLIESLQQEQKDIVAKSGGHPSEEDEKRYHEINEIINEINQELEERKNNPNRYFGNADVQELEKKLAELKKESKNIQSVTDKKVENLKDKLRKAKRLDKLKKLMKNKKITKKEHRKDAFLKGLAAVSGFATGMVLSSVPGIGTVRMGVSGIKLVSSGINFWTKKYPEGRVAKIKDATVKKFNDKFGEKINKFKENHPKIVSGVAKVKNTLSNDKFNWFVNGVAAGYITGNVIEMATGQTVTEHITNFFDNDDTSTKVVDNVTKVTSVVTDANNDVSLNPGDVVDISGIGEGYVSSTASKSVNLLTELGKNVSVDREVNGMVHFIDNVTGEGYAWIPKDQVVEYLSKAAEVVGRSR